MKQVISVKFKNRGKLYYFDPGALTVSAGESVVVETSKGLEIAECCAGNHFVANTSIVPPLRPALRAATQEDLQRAAHCREREREAFDICQCKIAERGLDMKLVDVESSFEGGKITFFFTSDGRVDFRDLVKDLAVVFRARIELRQIGVRDEAKLLGGLGICGRPFCCSQFLDDFHPVSTKMAKVQSLSLNPTKISGSCGRLMCCLRYEQDAYEELVRRIPKQGAIVETPGGSGSVVQSNILRQTVKVRLDGAGESAIKVFSVDELKVPAAARLKEPDQRFSARDREPDEDWDANDDILNAPEQPLAQSARKSGEDGARPPYRRKLRQTKNPAASHVASPVTALSATVVGKQKNRKQKRPAAKRAGGSGASAGTD